MKMSNNKRLVLSVSEADIKRIDSLSEELGMNRSQYIRYLLSARSKILVPSIRYKELIKCISNIDLSLRVVALKEDISNQDKIYIESSIKELKQLIASFSTSGQVD